MSLTPKVTGAPAVIWLVYGDLDHDDKHSNFSDVTWCEDSQYDSDVRYVRSDLVTNSNKALAENERLRAALTAWRHADWCESDEGAHIPIEVHEARRLTDEALEQKP